MYARGCTREWFKWGGVPQRVPSLLRPKLRRTSSKTASFWELLSPPGSLLCLCMCWHEVETLLLGWCLAVQ